MNEQLDPDEAPPWLAKHVGITVATATEDWRLIAGINNDDCAIIEIGGLLLILTTDYVNATPIMLQLGLGSFYDLGRYLITCNLADLCGTGARPIAVLTSIMWRRAEARSFYEELMHGAHSAAEQYDVRIIGGDTKLARTAAYSATAIGFAHSASELFIKNRASAGQGVWVSGPLGSCAAAVVGWDMPTMATAWRDWARRAIVEPSLPLEQSQRAASLRTGGAGTDLSDGLGSDLASLCDASNVGVEIIAQAVPTAAEVTTLATRLGVHPYSIAFTVGGDLQFLITADDRYSDHLRMAGMTRIGTIHADPAHRQLVQASGRRAGLPSLGHRDAHAMTFQEEVRYLLERQRSY